MRGDEVEKNEGERGMKMRDRGTWREGIRRGGEEG